MPPVVTVLGRGGGLQSWDGTLLPHPVSALPRISRDAPAALLGDHQGKVLGSVVLEIFPEIASL